ncbi:carboxynorspermidine decarboxylase [Selenomonas sp. TAMA-11512]|uniref:carboxynorspermidine decarboxylase n=1 Tax=Selenomonas sp. TAMA-11512 TaxID=3095337 RepID=UPI00308A4070|nr:carboxynorspermidine decarboxylase [Selenomonas sp. TAMA-11512]
MYPSVPTPFYMISEAKLIKNLEILAGIQRDTGASILLAQKAFSAYYFYPLVAKYLAGTAASGLYEARLAHEIIPETENHVFSPAFKDEDFEALLDISDHFVFNSFSQWKKFKDRAIAEKKICGLRINPEHSTQETAIYDPCSPGSRLGIRISDFVRGAEEVGLDGITGLHFHTLCEQGAEPLAETLDAVETKFGKYLTDMKWINFGGGHHITRPGYDIELLKACIRRMRDKYRLKVYIEPGEAIAYHAGCLVAQVLDFVTAGDGREIAILDTSAACHMPDVIEMPYRPPVKDSGMPEEKAHTYRFAGPTCLAGDTIGEYSFDAPLAIGSRIVFEDMAIYTMVKNNTFNGMPLPAIMAEHADGRIETVRKFGYEDFKMRLS